MNTTDKPTTPSDAPTPDEHKCGYICNHCKQHFPGYAQYWGHKCKTPAPPTEGSAVEWVQKKLFPIHDDDGREHWDLCKSDALELARRADEAEIAAKVANDVAAKHWDWLQKTEAQLAAAQTNAQAMDKWCQALEASKLALEDKLAAAQARAEEAEKKITIIGERAVVDWDNNTVREVDAAVKGSSKYNDWLRYVLIDVPAQLTAAQARIADLEWVEKKLNGRIDETETQLAQAQAMVGVFKIQNDEICDQLATLRQEAVALRSALENARAEALGLRNALQDLVDSPQVDEPKGEFGRGTTPRQDASAALAKKEGH